MTPKTEQTQMLEGMIDYLLSENDLLTRKKTFRIIDNFGNQEFGKSFETLIEVREKPMNNL